MDVVVSLISNRLYLNEYLIVEFVKQIVLVVGFIFIFSIHICRKSFFTEIRC